MEKSRHYLEKLKQVSKEQWLVLALAGVVLLLTAVPVKKSQPVNTVQTQTEDSSGSDISAMEERLQRILLQMEGAGQVQVMITQKDGGEKVVEKDVPMQQHKIQEENSQGTVRQEEELQKEEATVYTTGESGNQEPYVTRELAPQIEGVLVLAQGGDDPIVEKNITDAVMALFGLEAHKIKVMKMDGKEKNG